ncbi:hypothetical protein [Pseudomonas sp. S3_A03]
MKNFRVTPTDSNGQASRAEIVKVWYVIDDYLVHFSVNSPEEAESLKAGLELAKINLDIEKEQQPLKRYELGKYVAFTSSKAAEIVIGTMSNWILKAEDLKNEQESEPDDSRPELKPQVPDNLTNNKTKKNTKGNDKI